KCVDTQVNAANCGSCGNACPQGHVCSNGSCALVCAGGTTKCGSKCVDTQVDGANCGSCGAACPQGQACGAGQCKVLCGPGTTNCSNVCVDLQVDPNNCGQCAKKCGQSEQCKAGVCQPALCGNNKVDPGEEYDPPPGPFSSAPVLANTCRWDFSKVEQLYCNGGCSWSGGSDCDQTEADIFCKLKMDNSKSTALSWQKPTALAKPGFSCPSIGNNLGPLVSRGVNVNVWYQDSSILGNHGAGNVITNVQCTNP
ncbi:MAG: hypothetical protein HY744_13835, partial [Deltaproteobacteria bacterium]|nr:hypothetical protein [Deltaproteobacteria bacterium]